jgi:hypothetical protein
VFQLDESKRGAETSCPHCRKVFTTPAAVVSGTRWYLARGKNKLGPYSSSQLKEFANSAQLRPEDMLLREGDRRWAAASQVMGLFDTATMPARSPAAEALTPSPSATASRPPGREVKQRPVSRPTQAPLFIGLGVGALLLLGCCVSIPVWFVSKLRSRPNESQLGADQVNEERDHAAVKDAEAATPVAVALHLKRYPGRGKSTAIRESLGFQEQFAKRDGKGGFVKWKEDVRLEKAYRLTVTEASAGSPRKYKETYTKAIYVNKTTTRTLPIQGRVLWYEGAGDKCRLAAPLPPELNEADHWDLDNSAARREFEAAIMPSGLVKAGDTWPLPAKALPLVLGADCVADPAQAKGEARLVKLFRKDNRQWGVIEFQVKLGLKKGWQHTFEPPAAVDLKGRLESVLDGSSTVGTLTWSGRMVGTDKSIDGQRGQKGWELDQDFTFKREREAETDPLPDPKGGDITWTEFTSAEHRFSVLTPAPMRFRNTKEENGLAQRFEAKLEDGPVFYSVVCMDCKQGVLADPQAFLDRLVEELGDEVKSKEAIKLENKYPGLEIVQERSADSANLRIKMRVYVVGQRYYEIKVVAPFKKFDGAMTSRFLDSFKLAAR